MVGQLCYRRSLLLRAPRRGDDALNPLACLVVVKWLCSGGALGTGKAQAGKRLLTGALDLLQMAFEVENVEIFGRSWISSTLAKEVFQYRFHVTWIVRSI